MNNLKCNCGLEARYSHFVNNEEKWSCNKYGVCPTYDELMEERDKLRIEINHYRKVKQTIADFLESDYE